MRVFVHLFICSFACQYFNLGIKLRQKLSSVYKSWSSSSTHFFKFFRFVSSVRSSSAVFILVYYIPRACQLCINIRFGAILPILYNTFTFHFDSAVNIKNRTRHCFCINYIDHARRHNFLKNSTRFFKFL